MPEIKNQIQPLLWGNSPPHEWGLTLECDLMDLARDDYACNSLSFRVGAGSSATSNRFRSRCHADPGRWTGVVVAGTRGANEGGI